MSDTPPKLAEKEKKPRLDRKSMSQYELSSHENERKRLQAQAAKKFLAGRQRAAILEYKKRTGATSREMALAIDVNESTVHKWIQESQRANWDKLAMLGIKKPEGL